MGGDIYPMCSTKCGLEWIDDGTMCRSRSSVPGPMCHSHSPAPYLIESCSLASEEQPTRTEEKASQPSTSGIPSYVTEELKQKLTATLLAESYPDQEKEIRWVYYTRINKQKGIKGLEGSTAYAKKGIWYKIWLYILGDKTYGRDSLPTMKNFEGFSTIEDFCERNNWIKTTGLSRATRVKQLVNDMFLIENPYKGWIGQGNVSDFNREDRYWKMARQYYWMQLKNDQAPKYVKVLSAGNNTQFIFDAESIERYFSKNLLPEKVEKYR